MSEILEVSSLGHTWILDLDGTIVKHNGYRLDGYDTLLKGAKEFMDQIPAEDMVIFITSRNESYREQTVMFLKEFGIRYDTIIFNAPFGERIIINDEKPSGLKTAISLNIARNTGLGIMVKVNLEL